MRLMMNFTDYSKAKSSQAKSSSCTHTHAERERAQSKCAPHTLSGTKFGTTLSYRDNFFALHSSLGHSFNFDKVRKAAADAAAAADCGS